MLKTFIFIGRSGCGKGTQAELLKKELEATGEAPVFYLETGARFREFIKGASQTAAFARDIMHKSARQPDFLAIWNWSHLLVEEVHGKEHWIIDGTPRSRPEAEILDTAFPFYDRQNPTVVYLNVSRSWSEGRLRARGRADDKAVGDIAARLDWFDRDVMPAVEYYRANPRYTFLDINGERSIEEIHADIREQLR
jgi:adenylate kinase